VERRRRIRHGPYDVASEDNIEPAGIQLRLSGVAHLETDEEPG
jgi:hypothetical protein